MKVSLTIIAVLGVSVVVLAFMLYCARADAKKYRMESERLADSEALLRAENNRIRVLVARANDVLERGLRQVEEAKKRYDIRNQGILESDPDWLVCPLPDGVRDAFMSADGGDASAVRAP